MLKTAVILAGGFGTRLKAVVSDLPKPMAPVNMQPFLNYQLRYLKNYGIAKIILSVGHLAEKITEYYGSGFEGMTIVYSREPAPLGTGGGIRLALEHCSEEEVLVLNGDSFFDVPLDEFYKLHHRYSSESSLALRQVANASRYGSIMTNEDDRIISFREKSANDDAGMINGGIYILNKELYYNNTKAGLNFSIEKDFFQTQLNNIIIKGFQFDGYFIDIGIPEDYTKAQDDFKGFKY